MESDDGSEVELRRNPSRKARNSLRQAPQPQLDDLELSDHEQDEESTQASKKGRTGRARADDSATQLDNSEEEAEEPPKSKRGRKKARKGAQKEAEPVDEPLLRRLPFDILLEVGQLLQPRDLLNLSRTNKAMRAMMLDQATRRLWAASLDSLPVKMPACPSDLSLPAFVSLFFETDGPCMLCGTFDDEVATSYYLRIRLCKTCDRRNFARSIIFEGELEKYIRNADELVFDYVHSDRCWSRGHDNRYAREWVREENKKKKRTPGLRRRRRDPERRPCRYFLPELRYWARAIERDDEELEDRYSLMQNVAQEHAALNEDLGTRSYWSTGQHPAWPIYDYDKQLGQFNVKEAERLAAVEEANRKTFMENAREQLLIMGQQTTDHALADLCYQSRQSDDTSTPNRASRGRWVAGYGWLSAGPRAPLESSHARGIEAEVPTSQRLLEHAAEHAAKQAAAEQADKQRQAAYRKESRNNSAIIAIRNWLDDHFSDTSMLPGLNTIVHFSDFFRLVANDRGERETLSQEDIDAALESLEDKAVSWMQGSVLPHFAPPPMGTFTGDLDDEAAVLEYMRKSSTLWKCTAKFCGKLFAYPALLHHGHHCGFHGRYEECFDIRSWESATAESNLVARLLGAEGPFEPEEASDISFEQMNKLEYAVVDDMLTFMNFTALIKLILKPIKIWDRARALPHIPKIVCVTAEDHKALNNVRDTIIKEGAVWLCSAKSCQRDRNLRYTRDQMVDHLESRHPKAYRRFSFFQNSGFWPGRTTVSLNRVKDTTWDSALVGQLAEKEKIAYMRLRFGLANVKEEPDAGQEADEKAHGTDQNQDEEVGVQDSEDEEGEEEDGEEDEADPELSMAIAGSLASPEI